MLVSAGHADAALAGALQQPQHQVAGALLAAGSSTASKESSHSAVSSGIDVRQVRGEPVADDVHPPRLLGSTLVLVLRRCLAGHGCSLRGSGWLASRSPIVPLDVRRVGSGCAPVIARVRMRNQRRRARPSGGPG